MMYVRYPLSLRNVDDQLFERGVDIACRLHRPIFRPGYPIPVAPTREHAEMLLLRIETVRKDFIPLG